MCVNLVVAIPKLRDETCNIDLCAIMCNSSCTFPISMPATVAAPEVYTVPPPQPKETKPGQLKQWQVDQFFEKGFVLVPSFFTEEEMQPAIEAVEECVDTLADKLYNGGKIKDKCEKAGFYERLTLIEQQFNGAAVLLHKMGYLPPGFRQLWANERLLNVVEQFIGPDIAGEFDMHTHLIICSQLFSFSLVLSEHHCMQYSTKPQYYEECY